MMGPIQVCLKRSLPHTQVGCQSYLCPLKLMMLRPVEGTLKHMGSYRWLKCNTEALLSVLLQIHSVFPHTKLLGRYA